MQYRDVTYVDKDGGRGEWFRVPANKVDDAVKIIKEEQPLHTFATIQTFFAKEKSDSEEFISDFYSDFDAKEEEGMTLENALNDTQHAIKYYTENLKIDRAYIKVWYTGNRGFHIVIPHEIFGAEKSDHLNKIWHTMANKIAGVLGLKSMDMVIYSKRRMWRVENTVHGKSGLYKIPLGIDEVASLTVGEIQDLAKTEQVSHFDDYEGQEILLPNKLYQAAVKEHKASSDNKTWSKDDIKIFDDPPPCIAALLDKGVLELGTVNMVMFRLAAFFKSQGSNKIETTGYLRSWCVNIPPSLTHSITNDGHLDLNSLHSQVGYVCNTVYNSDQYGFSCAGIKQIAGMEDYCTEECQKSLDTETEVGLFDALDVQYLNTRLSIQAEAVGRRDDTIAYPKQITANCSPTDTAKCSGCPLYGQTDGLTIDISAKRKGILSFIEPSRMDLTGLVGACLGLPNRRTCSHWFYKVVEANCEIIFLSPMVSNNFETGDKYTQQSIYFLGKGLEPNKSYKFSGYLHYNANNRKLRLVMDKAELLSDSLSNFNETAEMKEEAKIFRPDKNQSIEAKHEDIASALSYNHIRIWGRNELVKAVDLAYHSVRKFNFQRELVNGWIDLLVIGDTGQGKSTIVEKFMEYYDLGMKVSGESAGRTGLLWTVHMKEGDTPYIVWGVLPRYTGRLVCIDELSNLVENGGFNELKDVRSSGTVTVAKTVFGQAMCETRIIWLTNPVEHKSMGSYNFPVLAIQDLIDRRENIRRFTYAIGVVSNQVEDEVINENINDIPPVEDKYSAQVCHNQLMWVWNLRPDDIIISNETEDTILKVANYMCRNYIAKIPLIEPGDFRLKLARVSVAVAARMNNRSLDNKLVVTPDHVEYAYNFIDNNYSDRSLNYKQYSATYAGYMLDDEQMADRITNYTNKFEEMGKNIAEWIVKNPYTSPKQISSMYLYDIKEVRDCLSWLAGNKFIEDTIRGSYYKNELGVMFFEKLVGISIVDPSLSMKEILSDDEKGDF